MTRRRDIEKRLRSLGEIDKILGSMRNLSYLETRKLDKFMSSERRMIKSIENAAADFLYFYPDFVDTPQQAARLFVIIGSERGFCGDFNEYLMRMLEDRHENSRPMFIAVGQKLATALEGDPRLTATLEGPSASEEVHDVLLRLISTINGIREQHGPLMLNVVYHDSEEETVRDVSVLPPFQDGRERMSFGYPPRLNLPPGEFIQGLIGQYLFAALYQMFYTSLMAEQQQRIQHLDGAMKRLEERMRDLALKRNTLRQEEIVEEIEVILLGAAEAR